jgi:carbamoyltransferase
MIGYEDGQIRNLSNLYYTGAVDEMRRTLPHDWSKEDLASSVQTHLEDVAVRYVRHWLERSGRRLVCLAGGVFANVRLNQRIAELDGCDQVFVFPAMGDGGLAAGAAWDLARTLGMETRGIDHVYLGEEYDDRTIERCLSNSGVDFVRCSNIEAVVAALIHRGHVVARHWGRMEFGPRALGARSILYRTTDPSVNRWLNERLKRTEFMPFAPACLPGFEQQLFQWNDAASTAAKYMTITLGCTPWMKEHCPAVVHVDGTARPQIVDPQANQSFFRIVSEYHALSGIPAVVNTSFNMHEEPIVCTPEDALRAYQLGHLDNLAIGDYLVGKDARTHTTA